MRRGVAAGADDAVADNADAEQPFSEQVDVLIVATPLELSQDLEFHLKSEDSSSSSPQQSQEQQEQRTFQTTHATFISGRLRSGPFAPVRPAVVAPVLEALDSVLSEDADFALPASILTTDDEAPFTSIAAYSQDALTGRRVYKVFSRAPFGPDLVDAYFSDIDPQLTTRIAWKAYPRYEPPERFEPSFRLLRDQHVWNPTALEPAASCMELQAIAARNVALAVAHRWKEKARTGVERSRTEEHDEL